MTDSHHGSGRRTARDKKKLPRKHAMGKMTTQLAIIEKELPKETKARIRRWSKRAIKARDHRRLDRDEGAS